LYIFTIVLLEATAVTKIDTATDIYDEMPISVDRLRV